MNIVMKIIYHIKNVEKFVEMILFVRKFNYKNIFQLIVAVERDQLARLDDLYQRAKQNGVQDIKMVDSNQIKEIEPNCRVGFLIYNLFSIYL